MFTVYIKPTEICNLRCNHCYVPEAKRTENYERKMSIEQFNAVIEKFLNFFKNEQIHFQLHGGDPMVMGLEYCQQLYDIWKDKIGNDKPIKKFGLQTNLTLYTPEWDFLIDKMFGNILGTSFDYTRKFAHGGFDLFMSVWDKKFKTVNEKFYVPVEVTLHRLNIEKGARFWKDFINKYQIQRISFGHYTDIHQKSELFVPYSEYLAFLEEFTDLCSIEEIKKIKQIAGTLDDFDIVSTFGGFCHGGVFSSCCTLSHVVVNPDGSVGVCPAMAANDLSFGNIFTQSVEDIMNSEKRKSLVAFQMTPAKECVDCDFSGVCNYGCPVLRKLDLMERNKCKEFFKKLRNYSILSKAEETCVCAR